MENLKIVVSEESFHSKEVYDIIASNISMVNLIREEGGMIEKDIHPDALLSYLVDYYIAQYKNGNFSQIVWNSGADLDFLEKVEEGLEKMGAKEHLALLQKQVKVLKDMNYEVLEAFLETDYFGTNPTRDALKNDDFYSIKEDVVDLNAKWLRNHPDLAVLSIEDMYRYAEKILGTTIVRE